MDFKKIIDKKYLITTSLVIIAIIILFAVPGLNNRINNTVQYVYASVRGEEQPDTNIVIIDISENDINNLGHWPIKRSYYALLIKNLSEHKVKKIGLEIFLSAKYVTQTLYDNLLAKEIKKAGNVVLSAVAGGDIYLKNGKYYTDSLSYPSPKLLNENLITGHLNYFSTNGIKIPMVIHNDGIAEDAFALEMYGKDKKDYEGKKLDVNFVSGWKKFKHISLIKYFQMVNKHDPEVNNLKGKYVIIGISDPLIASTVSTDFESKIPGVALHAFALDNLLENRGYNDRFISISEILFLIFSFGFLFLLIKKVSNRFYSFAAFVFAAFIILTFILYVLLNVRLEYSFFLLPVAVMFLSDIVFIIIEKNMLLEDVIDESKLLRTLLANKENELAVLQKELDLGSDSPNSLIEKIKLLKEDISKLKENEQDKKVSEPGHNGEIHEFEDMIFRSKSMLNVTDIIKKVSPGNANILILGESGTGKELAARAVHALSERSKNKFVAVNCGALSDTLLESELFGHVKGAYTGAVNDKIGRFEAADNGTIFLDEIAETSENFQVKLLRIIQSGDFEKVGSSKTQHVNVRIIAATNKQLDKEVKGKNFREDLYYRLNVIKIELPPLRERKEDIEILAAHFLKKEYPGMKLSKAAADSLNKYDWKGNIRELEAAIKRAVIFAKSSDRNMVQLADLPKEIVQDCKYNFEDMVIESLRAKNFSRSSITETAKELNNVSRTLISENFRGYSIKCYVENNFDFETSVKIIAGSDNEETLEKVSNKLALFLKNIENDLEGFGTKNFDEIKHALNSKYKNLPHKFHYFLDEIIKRKIR